MMETRKILLFVKTRDSKRNHEIEGYISTDNPLLEAKGFFNYFDENENIHIIPAENIEYFALSYSLVEYAEMEGFTDNKASANLINNTYTLDTNQDKVMDIEDCFSVAKGSKYIAFDTFGTEVVNRIFVPITSVKDITIHDNEEPTRYKASLLFDPTLLLAAIGKDNDYRVLDIFKNLKPTGITEEEVVQLYKAGFYNLDILPDGIAKGLDVYINHSNEIPEEEDVPEAGKVQNTEPDEDTEMTDEELAKAIEEQLEVPDRSDKNKSEEELITESLLENHKDLYDEVTSEFRTELTRLKAFSKYRLQQELANDHLIKANNSNYSSTLLDIEEAYYDILQSTGVDISKESNSFRENLFDYIRSM